MGRPRLRTWTTPALLVALAACAEPAPARPEDDQHDDSAGQGDPSPAPSLDAARTSAFDAGGPGAKDASVREHEIRSDGGKVRAIPAPPSYAIFVPPYEQPKGDPERGYDYLINGEYQRLGPNLGSFKLTQPPLGPADVLPGRRGDNEGLSYMFNAATTDNGDRVAAVTCLACHATHLRGELVLGLGRANRMVKTDHVNVAGIALANPLALGDSLGMLTRLLSGVYLGVMDVFPYLAAHRDPKTLVWTDKEQFNPDAGVVGWVDIPPWWRTKKKHGLYSNGVGRGVQGHHMSFMSVFSVKDTEEAAVIEQNFDDVGAFLRSLQPPKFPGEIDRELARSGETLFLENCATCHGTYGDEWTYPNVIIPYQIVGTDPSLATGHWMAPAVDWYAQSWYARDGRSWLENVEGYYAPPLDGIWATAPFFHNGSVPTLDGVIDPAKRPAVWTSNMSDDDYDLERVGWMDKPLDLDVTLDLAFGRYDTSQPGNSNRGHLFGAHLDESQQKALLEYLKTL
jgi:mono/diheme cytochrome c family protein